jgi:hypothetical protein
LLNPFSQYLAIGKLIAFLGAIGIICAQSSMIHRARENAHSCAVAREVEQREYINAQAAADAQNKAQIAKVKAEQERITGHVEQSYEADRARLRAELAKRLRPQAAKGSAGKPGASDLPHAAPVADDPSRVSIPTDLYVRGAELELQLERLQQWVREQVSIDPNK